MSAPSIPGLWRDGDLSRGLMLLADEAGLRPSQLDSPPVPKPREAEALRPWLESVAEHNGLELEWITAGYGELDELVDRVGPALLCLHPLTVDDASSGDESNGDESSRDEARWALVVGPASGRFSQKIRLLGPDGAIHAIPAGLLANRLRAPLDQRYRSTTESLLARAEVPAERRRAATDRLLSQRLGETPIALGYMLRPGPGADFTAQLRGLGTFSRLAVLIVAHGLQYALFLLSWWLMGRAALGGNLAAGWLVAWALLLLTLVPLRMGTSWLMGSLSIRVGAELKRRVLHGALSLDRDVMRAEGAGAALGRVIEAEAVETLAVGGGLVTVTALVELPFALWVLSQGAHGGFLLSAFVAGAGFAVWAGVRYYLSLAQWTSKRLAMTHGLVEKMAGHQTRLVQEPERHLHRGEDLELKDYLSHLGALDRSLVRLLLLPRAWMLLGLMVLAPVLVGPANVGASLAVSVGGLLLAQGILASLTSGITTLGAAWISWGKVAPLFHAAGRARHDGLPQLRSELKGRSDPEGEPPEVIRAQDLGYGYVGRSKPVLTGGSLVIREGDRLLVEGPSGGGKSTLASLLVGLREPTAGNITLYGLDRASVGSSEWRRRVVLVPQFHDNHVITETFAFNLLMGRGWPAAPGDFQLAWTVCQELGLGDLLSRMPGGLQQMVGETGWQLSHGEKSRLFLARALLQEADLLILDESFADLDPENLQLAMDCARRRGKTIMVIAHP